MEYLNISSSQRFLSYPNSNGSHPPKRPLYKVMIGSNTAWNLVNFRAGLIKALLASGYEVLALAPSDGYVDQLVALGCRYFPLALDSKGTNPIRDFFLFWTFFFHLRRERPAIFLGFTIKPNIYGSLAAHALGIPVINNITGLGRLFIHQGCLTALVRVLYRVALLRSAKVFFQNEDDRRIFVKQKLVRPSITDRLPGSGVDLIRFHPRVIKPQKTVKFLLISRMLWDKGVGEFVEAARILKAKNVDAEFRLLGFMDAQDPAAIPQRQIDSWVAEGVVRYLGWTDDVREEIAAADCIVLPTYREGVPRTLLEAAAMARPIITTDVVGSREVVDDGVNGFLCQPRDPTDLAAKMARFVKMSLGDRIVMGWCSRAKVEREFDERAVIEKYLASIAAIITQPDFSVDFRTFRQPSQEHRSRYR